MTSLSLLFFFSLLAPSALLITPELQYPVPSLSNKRFLAVTEERTRSRRTTMPEQSVFYRTRRKRGEVSYRFFRFNNSPAFLGSWGPFLESPGNLRAHKLIGTFIGKLYRARSCVSRSTRRLSRYLLGPKK